MSTAIRKALISRFGDPSHISIITTSLPPPPTSHVQVKVLYAGFGGGDINMRLGIYPMQKKAPLTPGYCLVGRIHTNGPECSKFEAGDLVACLSIYDADAELVNLPEKYLIPVPEQMDLQQAVALVLDWNTAYGMVHRSAKVTVGQRVFVHGLSGAVGYALFSLCKLVGAEVYGTASLSNHSALREAGAVPFVYSNKDWMATMKDIGGANVVFDALGYSSWEESYSILASDGHLIAYGGNLYQLSGDERDKQSVAVGVMKLLSWNLKVFCKRSTSFYWIARDQATFKPELNKLFELSLEGKITVPIKKVWGLEEVPEAHWKWNQGGGIGSSVVKIADDKGRYP